MKVKDIKEEQWWPQDRPVQIFPANRPMVARIKVGSLSMDKLEEKVNFLWVTGKLEPQGNDGTYYYFLRKSVGDLTPRAKFVPLTTV